MPSIEDQLSRWLAGSVIDSQTAERIRRFESTRGGPAANRPGLVEVLVYLGVAVIGVGAAILIGTQWDALGVWGRVAAVGIPGFLVLGAGYALLDAGQPALGRGGQVAWLGAAPLIALAAGLAFDEFGWSDRYALLGATSVALALTLVFWWFSREHPQVLGLAAAAFMFSTAVGALPGEFSTDAAWGLLTVFGTAGVALAEGRWLTPRDSARLLAGALLAFGAYSIGIEGGWQLVLVFVAGAALITLGVRQGVFTHVAVGVAAVFIGLITTVVREVQDPTAIALSLIAIGLVLVGTVVALAHFKPWRAAHVAGTS